MKREKPASRLTKRFFSFPAALVVLCAVSVCPVQAGDLFYTTCCFTGANNQLVAINVQDVNHITTTLIGEISGSTAALAMSASGTLYGMVGNPAFFVSQQLATIDRGTGNATLFGVPVPGLAVMSMGFAPDGTLYAVGGCNPSFASDVGVGCTPGSTNYNSLYTVDLGTGAFTLIGPTGATQYFMDLAFDHDGNMWGVACDLFPSPGDPSTLYRINRATGAATKVFNLVGSTSLMGLAFDGSGSKLYATDWYSNNSALYLVDMKTGFLTAIATLGYGFSSGLELAPASN